LLNIPVPPIYLAEDEFGRYSVIDGKQRITAIRDFMTGGLRLSGLSRFVALDGARFDDLPSPLRNALQVRPYIRAVALLRQSDVEVKYEVFHRLNTGGEALNAQEIRNVIYRGPLNDLIYQLAEQAFLKQQLKISSPKAPAYRKMADAEYVLRFLTLSREWQHFSGNIRASLDDFMSQNREAASSDLDAFGHQFNRAIESCEILWGTAAFKRYEPGGWRDQMLAGMFDAQMIAVSMLSNSQLDHLMTLTAEVLSATKALFASEVFEKAVRVATNTPSSLRLRTEAMMDTLTNLASS
jgi:hypothetical protein